MNIQKIQNTKIAGIPAVIAGEDTDEGFLFIHGKMGCKEEVLDFAKFFQRESERLFYWNKRYKISGTGSKSFA